MKRTVSLYVALAFVASCGTAPAPQPDYFPDSYAHVPADWPLLADAHGTSARRAIVVTEHPTASEIGAKVLRAGGTAIDAAVAVGFALAVLHPTAGNIGGGGFMVARMGDTGIYALDYREKAPGGSTPNMFQDSLGNLTESSVIGHLASGVPGSVAGLAEAHTRFGTMAWEDLVEPAIELAESGFVMDAYRAGAFSERKVELMARFSGSARTFLSEGKPPGEGTLFVQEDLARTLRTIAANGAAGFYRGWVADSIVAEMERGGGIITHEDLASYEPVWREPVWGDYRGYSIYSMPPSSSGGITMIETLNILEGFDPLPPAGSPQHVHLLAEAMRRAFIDRNRTLGDPDFVDVPRDRLLSDDYAAELRATIDPERASATPEFGEQLREGSHTTHYSIVDPDGNAVSITTTLNSSYGSAVVVSGAGFFLNNEMDDFTGAPGQPNQFGLIQGEANAIRPHKRMLSAMTPTIVLDPDGELFMVVGSPGGPRIITAVTLVISNVIDQGMSLAEAVAAPRVHHQSLPDHITYEPGGLAESTKSALRRMGHRLDERTSYSAIVSAIMRSGTRWVGVADPRGGGRPAGY